MLEQLGLGVVLSLEDEFTPQANNALSSFERLQSGAEGMVASVQKNMLQMRNLMMTGFTFQQMGEGIEGLGKKMVGTLENFGRVFVGVNANYQTLQSQLLTSFKGNMKEAEEAFRWVRQYSAETPFEVQGLTDAFAKMKSTNMDLREQFKLSNGEVKTFAEAMGDLATRNMGVTGGMENMGYAIQNAWAGQGKSLYDRFNFAKQDMKDMMKYAGKDSHKFMEEFVKLSQKLAPDAMRNLGGTWEQTMSNMDDTWKNFMYDVGKTGIFNRLNDCLNLVQEKLEEVFSNPDLIESFGKALSNLVKPLTWVVRGLANAFVWLAKFTAHHPLISKIAMGFLGIAGAVLTLTGFIMKLSGSLMLAVSSVAMLMMNFQLMSLTGVRLSTMFAGLSGVMSRLVTTMGILGVAGAGLFLAWHNNVGGLQTRMTEFFQSISTGWKLAKEAMKNGANLDGIMKNYQFKAKIKLPPLTKIFAGKFLKILAITKAFWQVFNGHFDKGVMHFSKKDWDLYEKAGIAGLVRGMVYAKDKIDSFFNGFKQGLTVVGALLKQFASMVWKPIKAIIDAVKKNINQYPNGLMAHLFIGKGGVDLSTAEKTTQMAHRLGKAVGIVVGAIAGMKVIGWITPVITRPFTKLYNKLAQIGRKAVQVKSQLAGLASGGASGVVSKVIARSKHAKYWGGVRDDMGKHIKKYDRTSSHPKGVRYRDGKFQTLNKGSVDSTYYNYFLKDKLRGGDQLQVKRRKTKLGKLLLGETYYRKGVDGSREKLGKFGGLFRISKDDRAIRNRATEVFKQQPMARDNSVEGLTHRPKIGDPIGKLKDLEGSEVLQGAHQRSQSVVRTTARQVTGLANSQFDRFSSVRQREFAKDYQGLSNKAWNKTITKGEMSRLRQYNSLGFDINNPKAFDEANRNNPEAKRLYSDVRKQRARNALGSSATYKQAKQQAKATSMNKTVYADTKAGAVRRMLFGQKLYTLNHNADGTVTQQKVGRRGGIFRREAKDRQYNTKPSFPRSVLNRVSTSRVGRGARYVGSKTKGALGAVGRGYGVVKDKITNNRVARGYRKVTGKVGGWYDRQRERVGLPPRVPKADRPRRGVMGAVRKTGGFLFGSKIKDAQGNVIGKRRGFIPKVGRGAMKVGKGMFKGIGAIGGLASKAMPLMALGGLAFRGISAKGAGADRKKLGLDPKASNFQAGLKIFQQSLSKIKFAPMWAKFKKEAKASFKILKQIAKDAFKELKPLLPKILKDAFTGIRGVAKLAWEWVKTDGVQMFGQLATSIMHLLGKAWEWVSANAGNVLGKVVAFVIGVVIPKLIAGVVKLGIFIITHIPQILKALFHIAMGIFKGILAGVKSIFKGIATFLWNTFKSALSGLKNVILGAIVGPIRSIPVVGDKVANALKLPAHHGGLWMSEDEHMAVIKKDETVLPPDKSRQLSEILTGGGNRRGTPVAKGNSHVDNSITIKEVNINVQADKLSKSDARKQALMIVEELKKMKREKQVRNYQDILTTGINL